MTYRSNVTIKNMEIKTFDIGIYLSWSSSNVLRDNSVANNTYNFRVSGSSFSHFVNDVDSSNTMDGKPVYYWIDERDKAVPLDAGYVVLVNCTNITVQNLNIINNREGILLFYTTNTTITKNNITNNFDGINIHFSSNNTIHHNNFINNNDQVYDSSWDSPFVGTSINIWNDGYPSGGNYWSDYTDTDLFSGPYQNESGSDGIWDHPYIIDGDNQDNYPIVPEFPLFLILPPFMTTTLLATTLLKKRKKQ